jgi:hypothetical protein
MNRDIDKRAFDQAAKRSTSSVSCRIIRYRPDAPGGPKALVVPHSVWNNWQDSYATEAEMLAEHGLEVDVYFPNGIRFHPDRDSFDILVDGEYHYAHRGTPKPKPVTRAMGNVVPRGWTNKDMALFQSTASPELKKALPHEVRRRAKMALIGGRMMTNCGSAKQDDYPQPGDFWAGPMRQDIDGARIEFWADVNNKIMQMSKTASQWATDNLRFPKTPGNKVVWRGKVENPMQTMLPSNAVTPYKRFITTLVDPGIILGAVQAVRTFFKELEGDTQFDFERIDRHEVIDFTGDVPVY